MSKTSDISRRARWWLPAAVVGGVVALLAITALFAYTARGTATTGGGDTFLWVGSERESANGSAFTGVWFLKNAVACNNPTACTGSPAVCPTGLASCPTQPEGIFVDANTCAVAAP